MEFMTAVNKDPASHIGYSKALRAIGYALEALQVKAFELTCEGKDYVVSVETERPKKKGLKALHFIFPHHEAGNSASDLQLIYTPEAIEQLEIEAQAKRQNAGMPDPYSLPAALRAVGAYVEIKEARLLKITKRDDLIIIRYQSPSGYLASDEFTPAALYAVCVRMYLKRRDRLLSEGSQ